MNDFFEKVFRTWVVWLVMGINIAMLIILNVIIYPYDPFDLFFSGYTPEQAMAHLLVLGEEGRWLHCVTAVIDVLYPAVHTFAYVGVTWRLVSHPLIITKRWARPWAAWLVWIFPVIMVLDYSENVCIWTMLASWPDESLLAAAFAGEFFTPVKWFLAQQVGTPMMIAGVLWWIWRVPIQKLRSR